MTDRAVAIFKRNVRARLDHLGVTGYHVAVATDHHKTWISQVLLRGGDGIQIGVIDDISEALGVPAREMVSDGFASEDWPFPRWHEGGDR